MTMHALITDEDRAVALRQALTNMAALQATGSDPSWERALTGFALPGGGSGLATREFLPVQLAGEKVAYSTLWRWMQQPWGEAIVEEWRTTARGTADGELTLWWPAILRHQAKIAAGREGEPRDAVQAFRALQSYAKSIDLLRPAESGQQASRASQIIALFTGPVRVQQRIPDESPVIEASARLVSESPQNGPESPGSGQK